MSQAAAPVRTTYREALRAALREALTRDPRVFLMGEDVGRYGGSFAVSRGLLEEFGPDRIRDTPLSESAFVGAGIGAALGGLRPIVEIMTVNFSLLALDQIMNNAATLLHMSGGQLHVPLVIRMTTGAGRQLAAQHSHSLEGWYAHIPGLKVLAPATLEDARGMLWLALEDPDPVLIFEHGSLYTLEGELAADTGPVDIARAAVRRPGKDLTLVTYGGSLGKSLLAADELATRGISTEVIDLRTLRPLDTDTILGSVRRTHRALIVDEGWRSGSLSAEITARIVEGAFYELDAPIARVCSAEVPIPYARHLEEAALPQVAKIVAAALRMGAPVAEFRMPSLGADMETGTLLEWRVAPGDSVHRGDIVALVDTDKAEIEVEIFCDGVIEELLVEPGRKVPVGTPLARLREPAAEAAQPAPGAPAAAPPAPRSEPAAEPPRSVPPAPPAPPPPPPTPAPPAPSRLRASPLARRVAAELAVDLTKLIGSGEGGAISRDDVERAAAGRAPAPAAAPAPTSPPAPAVGGNRSAGMRRAIAAAMSRSKREIPHYYLATRVDLTAALHWLGAENARRPVTERLLPAALQLRAVALALRETPELNGHWIDGAFRPSETIHIGVGIALRQGGLIAPALHDADRKPLPQLMAELRDLVARARAGSLRSSELSDATITLTNLGELGVEMVFGVIYPPQVAIVGFGRVREEPWAADGMLGVRPIVGLTLAADHRASDGHRGARFLTAIDRRLQSPETL